MDSNKQAVWDILSKPVDNRTPREIFEDLLRETLAKEIRDQIDHHIINSIVSAACTNEDR